MLFKRSKPKAVAEHGFVTGRVQSVAFRFYTRQEATQLQLAGWVRNLDDGRVEFHVQGPSAAVTEFLNWIRIGPPLAKVQDVSSEPVDLEGFEDFTIR